MIENKNNLDKPPKSLTMINFDDHKNPPQDLLPPFDLENQQKWNNEKFFSRYTLISLVIIICIGVIGVLLVVLGFILCNMYEDVGENSDTVYFIESP